MMFPIFLCNLISVCVLQARENLHKEGGAKEGEYHTGDGGAHEKPHALLKDEAERQAGDKCPDRSGNRQDERASFAEVNDCADDEAKLKRYQERDEVLQTENEREKTCDKTCDKIFFEAEDGAYRNGNRSRELKFRSGENARYFYHAAYGNNGREQSRLRKLSSRHELFHVVTYNVS